MKIPDPELIGEPVDGAIYDLPGGVTLVIGAPPVSLAGRTPLLNGSLTIRYAIAMLMPPNEAIVPGLFAAEKGGMLVGREAWDYLQKHFQVHPRADIVGIRLDGKKAQALVRELDFGVPIRVLAYESTDRLVPFKELKALVVGENAPPLPDLLAKYLPAVATVDTLL